MMTDVFTFVCGMALGLFTGLVILPMTMWLIHRIRTEEQDR